MVNDPNDRDDRIEEIGEFSLLAEQLARRPNPPLEKIFGEQMRQAKITFNVALAIGVFGAIVWLLGIVKLLFFQLAPVAGGITVASGQIMNILSFFMIKFHRETNSRLDEIRRDERAIELVATIQDRQKRDGAISDLAKALRRSPSPRRN